MSRQAFAVVSSMCIVVMFASFAIEARAQADAPSVVPAGEQAARDNDRLRILRDELAREARLAEDNTKRKAERLAANDAKGAQEREEALARNADNIRTLQREIEAATKQANGRVAAASAAPASVTATRRTGAPAASEKPWWDVYGRAPQRGIGPTATGTQAAAGPAVQPAAATR